MPPVCTRSAFLGACAPKEEAMSSLPPVATESTASMSTSTPAERSRREVEVLAALGQLERDLQRLSRALLPPAPPPRFGRRVRRGRVRRTVGGYPAL